MFRRFLFIAALMHLTLWFACFAAAQPPASGNKFFTPPSKTAPDSESRTARELPHPRVELQRVETLYQKINEDELKRPPQRDYTVQTGELQKTKLFRADPKLFENKFVAQMVLRPRDQSRLGSAGGWSLRDQPKEVSERMYLDRGATASGFGNRGVSVSEFFKSLAANCPAEQHPQELDTLTAADHERDLRMMNDGQGFQFVIYAPTAEQAQQRAAAILRLHDCGVSRPLQQHFLAEGQKKLAAARTQCEEYDRVRAERDAERGKLQEPSEVSTDILTELKAQRIMVAIELAGLSARVKACDQMLSPPKPGDTKRLEAAAFQAISDMKVKAEIERIGTQEKLDRINAFIAEGDRRRAIQSNLVMLSGRLSNIREAAIRFIVDAETHAQLVDHFAPRELENNTLKISPVEWTE